VAVEMEGALVISEMVEEIVMAVLEMEVEQVEETVVIIIVIVAAGIVALVQIICMQLTDVGKPEIGKFHSFLLEQVKGNSNRSYNKAMGIMKYFYTHYKEIEEYDIRNPFNRIEHMDVNPKTENIKVKEYLAMLEIVMNKELGRALQKNGTYKYLYKPWMKEGIELGFFTGRRNDEVSQMKWKDIFKDEDTGELLYLSVQDFKINNGKDLRKEEPKYIYAPITAELKDLLYRMGYEKYKDSDKYILAPEEKMKRKTIKVFLTRSFSHYYKQLGTGKDLTYGALRKTYITKLVMLLGLENARLITRHSTIKVMDKNYVNRPLIAQTGETLKMLM
jgi:integrase